jgi:hypothetical protein
MSAAIDRRHDEQRLAEMDTVPAPLRESDLDQRIAEKRSCCERHGLNCNQGDRCPEHRRPSDCRIALALLLAPWAAVIAGIALWHAWPAIVQAVAGWMP